MSKPTMLAVDDDPQVLASISRDLRSRYAGEYRIMRASSGEQAPEVLVELALRAGAGCGAPRVRASMSRDLRGRYAGEYRIMRASSGEQALEVLVELALRARPAAGGRSGPRVRGG